jgi:hypothetical protein
LWIVWRWRRTSWRIALVGLLIQAQIAVNHLMDAQVGLADIDASGLPFAIALAVRTAAGSRAISADCRARYGTS